MRRLQPKALLRERTALVAGLSGTVVEIGAGSGAMFPWYPPEVTQVIAVEPEPYLRATAARAAHAAPVPVTVLSGTAEALPVDDQAADAVVVCLVLCSVEDVAASLAEVRRVLRPGGELRYYEHVAERPGSRARRWQEWLDRSGLWARAGGGCRVARDTGAAIRAAGWEVLEEHEAFMGPPGAPVRRHLHGRAIAR